MADVQPPEGLRVDAIPGLPSVEVAHGIDCVLIVLPAPGPPHHTAATVLWAKQARQLATLLLRQADYAELAETERINAEWRAAVERGDIDPEDPPF